MPINYQLTRSRRKTMTLTVSDGQVYVKAPLLAPVSMINRFVSAHEDWIRKHLNNPEIRLMFDAEKDDHVYLIGKKYRLIAVTGKKKSMTLSDEYILIEGKNYSSINRAYRQYLQAVLQYYVNQIQQQLNVSFETGYRYYKSRWGCCYRSRNYISLNYLLACTDEGCIREVICHEICHFKHGGHQKPFYDELARICPDYKRWVKELKRYTIR